MVRRSLISPSGPRPVPPPAERSLNRVELNMLLYSARMALDGHVIRIEMPSSFELLDLVQLLSDRLSRARRARR